MPAPWTVEYIRGGYRGVDAEDKGPAYVYGLDRKGLAEAGHLRLTWEEARQVASSIAKLPDLLSREPG